MASTAPAQWWTDVAPLTPDAYTPPTYTPNAAADRNHGLFSMFRDNEFDRHSSDYRHGVIVGVVVFLGIGLAVSLLAPMIYCCVGHTDDCFRRAKSRKPGAACTKFWFWLLWLIAGAGAGLSIAGYIKINDRVRFLGDTANTAADDLSKVQNLARNALAVTQGAVPAIQAAAQRALACVGVDIPATGGFNVAAITERLQTVVTQVENVAQNPSLSDAIDKLYKASDKIDESKPYRMGIVIAILAADVLCLVAFAFMACTVAFRPWGALSATHPGRTCCQRFTNQLFVLLSIIITVGSWIIVAIAAGGCMVGGDFCQDPDAYTLEAADSNTLVQYYTTTCGGAASSDIDERLATARTNLLTAAKQIPALQALGKVAPECAAPIKQVSTALSTALYKLFQTVEDAQGVTQCRTFNTLYVNAVYKALCQDLNVAFEYLLLGLFLLASTLLGCVIVWRLMMEQAIENQAEMYELKAIDEPLKSSRSLRHSAPEPSSGARTATPVSETGTTPAPAATVHQQQQQHRAHPGTVRTAAAPQLPYDTDIDSPTWRRATGKAI